MTLRNSSPFLQGKHHEALILGLLPGNDKQGPFVMSSFPGDALFYPVQIPNPAGHPE
ncbi:MAG TPA: hypothetical protein VKA34_23310 [Balneolales bacterium]|nr:hypothetical protein [Balneolales bacterium]